MNTRGRQRMHSRFLNLALAAVIACAALHAQGASAQDAPAQAANASPPQATNALNPQTPPQAPAQAPLPDWLQYKNPYVATENDIANPNRTANEIVDWAEQRISESLSFTPETLNAQTSKIRGNFTDEGWRQYVTYLRSSQMLNMVQDQHFSVTTIVNGGAIILNSGTVAGAYHWLVEAPIIIGFTSKDDKGQPVTVAGGTFKIDMQLGRVAEGGNDGMKIESWAIESAPQQQ